MLFPFPASCLHPGSVADIRHLDNISKGMSPSSPFLVLKSSQNVTNTTQTCLRVGFQHRENLLLCPPRSVSQELIRYRRACSHSSRELIRGELAPLIVPSLLLWSWSSASRVTPSTSSTPHSHLRRFYQKHVFSNHDLTALTHGEVLSRLAGKLPKRVELVAKEAQYIGGK